MKTTQTQARFVVGAEETSPTGYYLFFPANEVSAVMFTEVDRGVIITVWDAGECVCLCERERLRRWSKNFKRGKRGEENERPLPPHAHLFQAGLVVNAARDRKEAPFFTTCVAEALEVWNRVWKNKDIHVKEVEAFSVEECGSCDTQLAALLRVHNFQ